METASAFNRPVQTWWKPLLHASAILALIYALLLAVAMISSGFKWAAADQAKALFAFADNPIIGLMVGLLATALMQSSSTVTSVIVGLVAGGLPIEMAVPMVMGANMGTTVTNTIVSLGYIRQSGDFKYAFSAATVHDFFNLLAVVIFLPLEIIFGVLQKTAGWLSHWLVGSDSLNTAGLNFIKPITQPVSGFAKTQLAPLGEMVGGIILALMGIALIFITITLLTKVLQHWLGEPLRQRLLGLTRRHPVTNMATGTVMTVLVQSSSVTTSLLIPMAGARLINLRELYPVVIGANIGTCVTALLAATAISGELAHLALQIALVHLLFNGLAALLLYGVPVLRDIPPRMAIMLAKATSQYRLAALAYVGLVFFALPGTLIALF